MGVFHHLSVDWAVSFGIKESLILTGMCSLTLNSENGLSFNGDLVFTGKTLKEYFPYLTEKQIRNALDNLVSNNNVVKKESKRVERAVSYFVTDKTYREYKKMLTEGSGNVPAYV